MAISTEETSNPSQSYQIGNLSTQLDIQLESEIDGTRGLSSQVGYTTQTP